MDNKKVESCISCGICTRNCLFLEKYEINLKELKDRKDLAYHCFLCGKCDAVCPKGISGKEIALENRREAVRNRAGKLPDKSYDGLVLEKSPYKFANYRHADKKSVLFTGCNFPSFFPETTERLVEEFAKYDVGVIFDCCGKPIGELGLEREEGEIIERINTRLKNAGVTEVIMVCPNCFYYLKDRLDVRIVSVYRKMKEFGIGHAVKKTAFPIHFPCPDREMREIFEDMLPFLNGEIREAFPDVQCCGLGGCAAGKESDVAQALADRVKNSDETELYTYCASCISSFRRRGYEEAYHLLPMMLDIDEKVPLGKTPILNRARFKFK